MVLVYLALPYVVLCLLLAVFQRSLMYVPTREKDPLTPADAGAIADLVETIQVETDDGLTLNGWHVRRPSRPPEPHRERRLVLYFHGNAGNRRLRVWDCRDFVDEGLEVFLFDYRGYGDNPGQPSEEKLVEDAHAVWRFATEEHGFEPRQIILYGESLGGGVAIRLANELCRSGVAPAGLLVSSSFSSMTEAAGWHYPFVPVSWLLWDRYESQRWIADVTCPYVHVHGEVDRIVPIDLGRKLFDAAPPRSANGVEKRFVALANRGHNNVSKREFATIVSEMLDDARTLERPVDRTAFER